MEKIVNINCRTFGMKVKSPDGAEGVHSAMAIIGEAYRDPSCSRHVSSPAITCWREGPRTASQCRAMLKDHVANSMTVTKAGVARNLHPETHILSSDIVSVTATEEDYKIDPQQLTQDIQYLRDAAKWIESDIISREGRVLNVIVHRDEPHLHIHVLSVAGNGKAKTLHPGHLAKETRKTELQKLNQRAKERGDDGDVLSPKEINREADEAYRLAMSDFVTRFWMECAECHGYVRCGETPKPSLSWHDWKRAEEAAVAERTRDQDEREANITSNLKDLRRREESMSDQKSRLQRDQILLDHKRDMLGMAFKEHDRRRREIATVEAELKADKREVEAETRRWNQRLANAPQLYEAALEKAGLNTNGASDEAVFAARWVLAQVCEGLLLPDAPPPRPHIRRRRTPAL